MKIGIIGARLAGSYAGLLLSRMGHEVLLFDDCVEKEKPCAVVAWHAASVGQ